MLQSVYISGVPNITLYVRQTAKQKSHLTPIAPPSITCGSLANPETQIKTTQTEPEQSDKK